MIKYKIVEVNPTQHSIVVRYYSDIITEGMMATQKDAAGVIVRCRTDYNIDLPIPAPVGAALAKFIMDRAPSSWLKLQEDVLNPGIDTSMVTVSALLGVVGGPATPTVAEALSALKTKLSDEIDRAVCAIYSRPMTLSKEYEARRKAAADYKAAGYAGVVPARLAGFATPAGLTATVAADLILAQAEQFNAALDSLSDLRMRKFEVQRATTEADAQTVHTAVMAQIATITAALG